MNSMGKMLGMSVPGLSKDGQLPNASAEGEKQRLVGDDQSVILFFYF
jgi:hypothetical protein